MIVMQSDPLHNQMGELDQNCMIWIKMMTLILLSIKINKQFKFSFRLVPLLCNPVTRFSVILNDDAYEDSLLLIFIIFMLHFFGRSGDEDDCVKLVMIGMMSLARGLLIKSHHCPKVSISPLLSSPVSLSPSCQTDGISFQSG